MSKVSEIGIGLISHTNIGKTSLARTLLRQDVGEIRDEAHVTLESTGYSFIGDSRMNVTIWDTPGFGGAVPRKLVKRLKGQGNPLQWLLRQTIDRFADKPTFSSVDAARTLAERCDVALYLVNAMEDPGAAPYVQGELDLIAVLGIPVVITVNQVGTADSPRRDTILKNWQTAYGDHPAVADIVVFDAFSRLWFEEVSVLRTLAKLVPEEKRKRFFKLIDDHQQRQLNLERQAAEHICATLRFASSQQISKSKQPDGKKALKKMLTDLHNQIRDFVDSLCADYNLTAENAPDLQADLEHLQGMAGKGLDEKKTGLLAGALSGASYGLAADAISGGLSFGGGALVGFVVGGFGGLFAAKGFNALIGGGEDYRWKSEFLDQICRNLLMIYLLIAHHGRGKGGINFSNVVPAWDRAVREETGMIQHRLATLYSRPGSADCKALFEDVVPNLFGRLYPDVEQY